MIDVLKLALQAKEAAKHMSLLSSEAKNQLLLAIAKALKKHKEEILNANKIDMEAGGEKGLTEALLDRLMLNESRVESMINEILKVAELKDYIGEVIENRTMPNGLNIERVRVPLGVIGIIYEARPNVTTDATALCLKSGNSVILKGGSDAINSNRAIVKIIKDSLAAFDQFNPKKPVSHAVQFIDSADRKVTEEFLKLKGLVDVIIPRGGKGLIDFVTENSRIPVIETGASVVHVFVDESADIKKAIPVIINSKLRRTGICNALDTLLVHENIAKKLLKEFIEELEAQNKPLEIRACKKSYEILKKITRQAQRTQRKNAITLKKAIEADFDIEFLAPVLAIKIAQSLNEAISHIEKHSLKHTEAILTENPAHAEIFLKEVDAGCVYWNMSTQFSDGAQFGLGAEIGISTQKLHCRGPFALEELTSYKWVAVGNYHTRPL